MDNLEPPQCFHLLHPNLTLKHQQFYSSGNNNISERPLLLDRSCRSSWHRGEPSHSSIKFACSVSVSSSSSFSSSSTTFNYCIYLSLHILLHSLFVARDNHRLPLSGTTSSLPARLTFSQPSDPLFDHSFAHFAPLCACFGVVLLSLYLLGQLMGA